MKHDQHLTWPEILWLFNRWDPGPHLLAIPMARIGSCATCRAQCGDLVEMLETGEIDETVDYFDLVLARSRRRARRIWSRLQDTDLKWMRRSLARAPALWGLVEILIEESRSQASVDRDRALAFAQMAVAMADRLPTRTPDDETLVSNDDEEPLTLSARAEALALAYAVLGNAYRVAEDIHEAARQFAIATGYLLDVREGCLFQGRARVGSLKGSLLTDTRQLREAVEVLEDALVEAREAAEPEAELVAAITVKLAGTLGSLGMPSEGIRLLESLLQDQEEAALSKRMRHLLRYQLGIERVRAGSWQAAQDLLPRIRLSAHGDDGRQIWILWLEARIAFAKGELQEALSYFRDVRDHFAALGHAHEVALATLEIALACKKIGDEPSVVTAAEEALALLIPLGIATEALGALTLLARHAERHSVQTRTLVSLIRWANGGEDRLPVELGEIA